LSSWLSKQLGTNSINQNFNYDPQTINYTPPPTSSLGLAAQRNTASMMTSNATSMQGMATQMMDPNSGYYAQQQQNLQEQIGGANTSANSQMNRQLAMSGQGGGSLRNLLANVNTSRVGEQVRQGVMGLQQQGMGMAGNFMGQANQALQGAGGLQAQAASTSAQFISAMEQNRLQADMANQAAYNEQQQFVKTSNYNQAAGNKAARGQFAGQVIGGYMGMQQAAIEAAGSDLNLKKNIKNIGKSNKGVNIYEFEYKDTSYGKGKYVGVMAQEVPWASFKNEDGYLWVDYSKVDVKFERIK